MSELISARDEGLKRLSGAQDMTNLPSLIEKVEAASGPDWTEEQIERTRERILRNTDPERVAKHAAEMKAWAERIGTPKRCKVGEVHPASGECLYCGAANGQSCHLGFGG